MTETAGVAAVILAAGKGTRIRSARAKVLHTLFGRTMVEHVVAAVREAGIHRVVVVTGHQAEAVEEVLRPAGVRFARQAAQLGTGDAVRAARQAVGEDCDTVLVLCGDTPLVTPATLTALLAAHRDNDLTVLTTVLDEPGSYGRVVSDGQGRVRAIVEAKDAQPAELAIREVNAGIYCIRRRPLFAALENLTADNQQGEYYLTDVVGIFVDQGLRVGRYRCPDPGEVMGINSREELARAEAVLQEGKRRQLMAAGVTLAAPHLTVVGPDVTAGPDCVIAGHVHLGGATVLGRGCTVEPFCMLQDCRVADGVRIGAGNRLRGQTVECDLPDRWTG